MIPYDALTSGRLRCKTRVGACNDTVCWVGQEELLCLAATLSPNKRRRGEPDLRARPAAAFSISPTTNSAGQAVVATASVANTLITTSPPVRQWMADMGYGEHSGLCFFSLCLFFFCCRRHTCFSFFWMPILGLQVAEERLV